MKSLTTLLLSVCALFLPVFGFNTVVIDAGHGGNDLGGTWGQVYEKHLALDTALRLERYLKMLGFRVVMTRREDEFLRLSERVAIANRYPNAVFVSVHVNKASRESAAGIETFYYSAESQRLGATIQNRMVNRPHVEDRGLKYAKYHVLRNARIPAVLAEIGFVSNRGDRSRLKMGRYRDEIALAIANGINAYRASRYQYQ